MRWHGYLNNCYTRNIFFKEDLLSRVEREAGVLIYYFNHWFYSFFSREFLHHPGHANKIIQVSFISFESSTISRGRAV